MLDLIVKKRDGGNLTKEEIFFWINGYVSGEIPDYQTAAMLMAIYYEGMAKEELGNLTMAMARSGDMVDLSPISGCKVDKHSTGGVGDKTTMIIGPMVAANGVKVAKMSGRGLGFTGGTIDKLEAIPGFRTALDREEFFRIVNEHGISVAGQSGNLVPADKKMYALRDVTGTVESIPLIASSIMSKKLASGSDAILLDVKTGSGAFMKTIEDAEKLAETMTSIGRHWGRRMAAMITNMDQPLGMAVGNTLEVIEAIETLKGHGPEDLTQLCLELAAEMMVLAGKGSRDICRRMALETLTSGRAFEKWKEMVGAQGGDVTLMDHPERFPAAPYSRNILAPCDGYIAHLDAEGCGIAASLLGAGRAKKEDRIDVAAGIRFLKKCGDPVKKGEPVALLYTSVQECLDKAEEKMRQSLEIADNPPLKLPMVFRWIS